MRRHMALIFACATLLLCFAAFPAFANSPQPKYTELKQLANEDVGTVLGTTYDSDVRKLVPDGPTFKYYSEMSEMLTALKQGRIAACCLDKPVASIAVTRNEGLAIMPENAGLDANAVALPKGSPLTNKVSEIVTKLVNDGTMEQLELEWCSSPNGERSLPERNWNTSNGTLVCAVDDATEPMSYRNENGDLVGLEVELAHIIAARLGYKLELVPMSFDAVMSSLHTSSVDMAIAGISITDERSEDLDLSPAYRSAVVTLVTPDMAYQDGNLFVYIVNSINASFMQYGHGTMLLSGLLVTLLLAAISVSLGIVLGQLLCILILYLSNPTNKNSLAGRKGPLAVLRRVALAACVALEKLLQEIPLVILLLVLRYVVFDFSTFPGVAVAVVGLSATLAAGVSSSTRECVESVGRQPWEVALSLGYSERQALRYVILPLARKNYIPEIYAAIAQTVFDTSVVGLIAVHDLTRMADLVRARTTEALPAMIFTAAVYLILSKLLKYVLKVYLKWAKKPIYTSRPQPKS